MDGTIRMVVASVLALVVSFAPGFCSYSGCGAPIEVATLSPESVTQEASLSAAQSAVLTPDVGTASQATSSVPEGCDSSQAASTLGLLPLLSFFFGFYPRQAILLIQRVASKSAKLASEARRTLPLSILAGMSYSHEIRLEREGFDNAENLSHADPVDLAVRTGFSYGQLAQWVEEAWLVVHLREDYPEFVQASGITSRAEFRQYLQNGMAADAAVELLIPGVDEQTVATRLKAKLLAVSELIDPA